MNKIFYILAFIILTVVIWIIVSPKNEHFGGGHSGGGHSGYFHGGGHFSHGRGYRRRFYGGRRNNSYWDYYYPYWYSYNDDIKSCIIDNVNKCGETKECYDMAINSCT
jgi:hypothetical protein